MTSNTSPRPGGGGAERTKRRPRSGRVRSPVSGYLPCPRCDPRWRLEARARARRVARFKEWSALPTRPHPHPPVFPGPGRGAVGVWGSRRPPRLRLSSRKGIGYLRSAAPLARRGSVGRELLPPRGSKSRALCGRPPFLWGALLALLCSPAPAFSSPLGEGSGGSGGGAGARAPHYLFFDKK